MNVILRIEMMDAFGVDSVFEGRHRAMMAHTPVSKAATMDSSVLTKAAKPLGVPAPSNCLMRRLRLKAPTWISRRLRMLPRPRKCRHRIAPVSYTWAKDRSTIGLPVANAGSVVCCGWALLDGSLACQSSSRVVGAVSLSPFLGGLSQAGVQQSAVSLVVPDVSVDGLMADLETSFEIQSAGDLLGAPVLLHQQDLDHVPVRHGEAEVSA